MPQWKWYANKTEKQVLVLAFQKSSLNVSSVDEKGKCSVSTPLHVMMILKNSDFLMDELLLTVVFRTTIGVLLLP